MQPYAVKSLRWMNSSMHGAHNFACDHPNSHGVAGRLQDAGRFPIITSFSFGVAPPVWREQDIGTKGPASVFQLGLEHARQLLVDALVKLKPALAVKFDAKLNLVRLRKLLTHHENGQSFKIKPQKTNYY